MEKAQETYATGEKERIACDREMTGKGRKKGGTTAVDWGLGICPGNPRFLGRRKPDIVVIGKWRHGGEKDLTEDASQRPKRGGVRRNNPLLWKEEIRKGDPCRKRAPEDKASLKAEEVNVRREKKIPLTQGGDHSLEKRHSRNE